MANVLGGAVANVVGRAAANVVCVITAVHEPTVEFLPQAYRSLRDQVMPTGWSWRWLVQQDGPLPALPAVLARDPRITIGVGRKGGPAAARNLALACAHGLLVKVLDADDQLTPGALARDIAAFAEQPNMGWTVSVALDLLVDGSTVRPAVAGLPPGPVRRGQVLRYFQRHNYRLPVHPATLCIRRDLLLALGGWMALPGGEDTGLLLAAAAVSDGYLIAEPGLLYRRHARQTTAQAGWRGSPEWFARMRLVEARALALSDRHSIPTVRQSLAKRQNKYV